jgi:hypothetical protein
MRLLSKMSKSGLMVCRRIRERFHYLTLSHLSTTELKKNTATDLVIYIIGAKADLSRRRAVTYVFVLSETLDPT